MIVPDGFINWGHANFQKMVLVQKITELLVLQPWCPCQNTHQKWLNPTPPFPSSAWQMLCAECQMVVKHPVKHLSTSCQASDTQHKASVKRLTETMVYLKLSQLFKYWGLQDFQGPHVGVTYHILHLCQKSLKNVSKKNFRAKTICGDQDFWKIQAILVKKK